jgi:rhodanese-related sulfurtransferase
MTTFEIKTPYSTHQVVEKKLTSLGLYVTAREAYDMWKADPERIKVLDVRASMEYAVNGHPEMAANIPVAFQSYKWDINKGDYPVAVNTEFVANVAKRFKLDDTILAMCRSGTRSAIAVNFLAKAGFTNVYNIMDGFDGDKVEDPESIWYGVRRRNGWKNSAVPWTYKFDPTLVWVPSDVELEILRKLPDM